MEENQTLAAEEVKEVGEKDESIKAEPQEPRRPLTRWEIKELIKNMKLEEKRRKKAKLKMPKLLFPKKHKK
jgi:hypothetical protein